MKPGELYIKKPNEIGFFVTVRDVQEYLILIISNVDQCNKTNRWYICLEMNNKCSVTGFVHGSRWWILSHENKI